MNRQEITQRLEATGIIPIVRAPSTELAANAARAVLAAGIDVIEITMGVPNALALVKELRSELGDGILVGAGTVLDAQTARECILAGAHFIVAPGLDADTVCASHALDRPCLPGALTPTEVIAAWRAGADMVKIFPCSAVGGASYLRALKAPLPHIKMFPTGGVDVHTAADFIRAGASVLGIGASTIDLKLLEQSGPAAITERCHQLMAAVHSARS